MDFFERIKAACGWLCKKQKKGDHMSNRAISVSPNGNGYRIVLNLSPSSAPYNPKNDYLSNTLSLELDDIESTKELITDLKSLLDYLERDVLEKEVTSKVTSKLAPLLQQENQEETEKELI